MVIPVEWWTFALGLYFIIFVYAIGLIFGAAAKDKDEADFTGRALILAIFVLALATLAIEGWTR